MVFTNRFCSSYSLRERYPIMDLHYLEYITTLAEEQNMSRCAERLHVSQPTLSVYVKKLEEELGIQLFIRSNNKMTLTPAGEAYVESCNRIFKIRDELYARLDEMKTPQLRIGITTCRIPATIAGLNRYHQICPEIKLLPDTYHAHEIDDALENQLLDFAMSPESLNPLHKENAKVTSIFLKRYELMLVISSENPIYEALTIHDPLTKDDMRQFCQLTFILQKTGTSKTRYDLDVLAEEGIVPEHTICLNNVDFMLQSIVNDNTYALIPQSEFADPRLRSLSLPVKKYNTLVLKYLSDRKLDSYDRKFIEVMKDYYQGNPGFYNA